MCPLLSHNFVLTFEMVLSLGRGESPGLPGQPSSRSPDAPHSVPPILSDELLACCLLGRIWGEPIPLPAIIHRTHNDWSFVKGHVEYVEMGNHWILIRFANAQDRML